MASNAFDTQAVSIKMWAQKDDKDFWLQWLERYKELKCLWDTDIKRQTSRTERLAAYQELAELAKVVNPAADVTFVRGRINAFRTCYRREFKKVEAARQNNITYIPQLFYFETLKFVNPEDYQDDSFFDLPDTKGGFASSIHSDDDDPISCMKNRKDVIKRVTVKREAIRHTIGGQPKQCAVKTKTEINYDSPESNTDHAGLDIIDDDTSNYNVNSTDNIQSNSSFASEDEYALFGRRIAAHFRNMQPNQRLLAEKIISDVCIYARMDKLSLQSSLIVETENQSSMQRPVEYKVMDEDDDEIDYDNPDTYIYTT